MNQKTDPRHIAHLGELRDVMSTHGLDPRSFCVVGSAALALHGLIENQDIDLLLAPEKREEMGLEDGATNLTEHVEVVAKGWGRRLRLSDGMFFEDPTLTIEVEGIRFARPEIVFNKKLLSRRPKDDAAVRSIEKRLAADPAAREGWDWGLLWLPHDDLAPPVAPAAPLLDRALRVAHLGLRAVRRPDRAMQEVVRRTRPQRRAVVPVDPLAPLLAHKIQTAALLHCQYQDRSYARLDLIVRYLAFQATESGEQTALDAYRRMQKQRGRGDNPERDLAALTQSLRTQGFLDRHPLPITKEGRLIDGAHRLACALYTGIEEVPVYIEPDPRPLTGYGHDWFVENRFDASFLHQVEETREEVFERIGIYFPVVLWPGVTPFIDEIAEWLDGEHRVVKTRLLDMGDDFAAFVRDIYVVDDIDWWKVERKIHAMARHGTTVGIVLLEVPDPEWRTKTRSHAPIAQVSERLKRHLRRAYRARVPGYVYDVVCHVGDNHGHNRQVLQAVRRYAKPDGGG